MSTATIEVLPVVLPSTTDMGISFTNTGDGSLVNDSGYFEYQLGDPSDYFNGTMEVPYSSSSKFYRITSAGAQECDIETVTINCDLNVTPASDGDVKLGWFGYPYYDNGFKLALRGDLYVFGLQTDIDNNLTSVEELSANIDGNINYKIFQSTTNPISNSQIESTIDYAPISNLMPIFKVNTGEIFFNADCAHDENIIPDIANSTEVIFNSNSVAQVASIDGTFCTDTLAGAGFNNFFYSGQFPNFENEVDFSELGISGILYGFAINNLGMTLITVDSSSGASEPLIYNGLDIHNLEKCDIVGLPDSSVIVGVWNEGNNLYGVLYNLTNSVLNICKISISSVPPEPAFKINVYDIMQSSSFSIAPIPSNSAGVELPNFSISFSCCESETMKNVTLNNVFPFYNGLKVPSDGAKFVPLNFDFSDDTDWHVDFTGLINNGKISSVQSFYIDNSTNTHSVSVKINSGYTITIPAETQGYVATMCGKDVVWCVHSDGGKCTIVALNYAVANYLWALGSSSGTQNVNVTNSSLAVTPVSGATFATNATVQNSSLPVAPATGETAFATNATIQNATVAVNLDDGQLSQIKSLAQAGPTITVSVTDTAASETITAAPQLQIVNTGTKVGYLAIAGTADVTSFPVNAGATAVISTGEVTSVSVVCASGDTTTFLLTPAQGV